MISQRKALAAETELFTSRAERGWITTAEFSAANVSLIPGQMEGREVSGREMCLGWQMDLKKCWAWQEKTKVEDHGEATLTELHEGMGGRRWGRL